VKVQTEIAFAASKLSSCAMATGRGVPAPPLPPAAIQIAPRAQSDTASMNA